MQLLQRIFDPARERRHVLKPAKLFHAFVRGIREATKSRMLHQMRLLPVSDLCSVTMVHNAAHSDRNANVHSCVP